MALDLADTIDPRQPMTDLGLDSLMAVELRNAIADLVGKALPATLLFDHPSLDELTNYLLDDVLASELETARPRQSLPKAEAPASADSDELDLLSEDEMANLLAQQVDGLKDN